MTIALGFLPKPLTVAIDNILPSRQFLPGVADSQKFKQIQASIREIDLIEPLTVSPVDRKSGQHFLLDGHIRLLVLRSLGYTEIPCLVATDDESYTYNNRINRLSSVQEHLMIRRAVDRGVSPQRLAGAFCVDITQILKKMRLLDGICPEAADLLKDRQFSSDLSLALKKMKPTRQVECAELMVSANNVTVSYARALLAATESHMLVDGKKPASIKGVSQDQMARMEREMTNLQDRYKMTEQTYGEDMLNLVLARGYLVKLIDNKQVCRYLKLNQSEVLDQFVSLVQTTSMDL